MRRFKEKLKGSIDQIQERFANEPANASAPSLNPTEHPTEQDIFQYRKQRGVNLGSWFVLERWISPSPFRNAAEPGQSDLDVARGAHAKEILEQHWDVWIVEEDWKWIRERGLNSVRIPIGYYHLCGLDPSVLNGTDFAPFKDVFEGAWGRIARAIETAYKYGIGVLIDLHAAPGKQNPDSHSGASHPPAFFSSRKHQDHTIHVLRVLLAHLSHPNIIGIQLLNEPHPPEDGVLMGWYTRAIASLRSINPSMPIYLGECWRTKEYAGYITSRPSSALTVLDHHLYRCFTKEDIHTPTSAHCSALSSTSSFLSSLTEALGRAHSGVVIGEWSGALNPGSLRGSWGDEQRSWIRAQLELYETDAVQGWFFWTFKKEEQGDWGWSLRDSVGGSVFPSFVGLPLHSIQGLEERKDEEKTKALDAHVGYWSSQPGHYAHHRFAEGFERGYRDALGFLSFRGGEGGGGATELGFTRAWARRRTTDYGEGYWEWEHGFVQGVATARRGYVEGC